RPSAEIKMNVIRVEAIREDPSLTFRPGCDLTVLKCDYQEIMLVAREFSSLARRDCNGKGADTVVFEQQTMMRLSRDIDWKLLMMDGKQVFGDKTQWLISSHPVAMIEASEIYGARKRAQRALAPQVEIRVEVAHCEFS